MTITYKQTDYTEPDRSYTEVYICDQNTDGYIEKETDPVIDWNKKYSQLFPMRIVA